MNKPIACNINALTPVQRTELFHQLEQTTEKVQELLDGYRFCYAKRSDIWMTAATFIDLERRCCPFFTFSPEQLPEGTVRLQMTGSKGVKAFMKNHFNFQTFL